MALPGTSVPALAVPGSLVPGALGSGPPGPPPRPSTAWLWYTSVPGMAVPGMACPGMVGTGTTPLFIYLGHVPGCYLDYLDTTTSRTLVAVPGMWYSMLAVNSRHGLTVPPPDNCWLTGTNKFAPRIVLRPRPVPEVPPPPLVVALDALFEAGDALARARVHSANFHAYHASRPVPVQPQGSPVEARVPEPREPSEAALTLAEARARNAHVQALRARGEPVGC